MKKSEVYEAIMGIDSLSAALTSDSARASVPRGSTNLGSRNADIIAIQETKLSAKGYLEILEELFPGYENAWRSSQNLLARLLEPFPLKELTPISFQKIGAPSTMDLEGHIIWNLIHFVTQVYTRLVDGLKRRASSLGCQIC